MSGLQDFQDGDDNDITIESHWQNIKQAWAKSCEEVVGKKKNSTQALDYNILHTPV